MQRCNFARVGVVQLPSEPRVGEKVKNTGARYGTVPPVVKTGVTWK